MLPMLLSRLLLLLQRRRRYIYSLSVVLGVGRCGQSRSSLLLLLGLPEMMLLVVELPFTQRPRRAVGVTDRSTRHKGGRHRDVIGII